MKRLRSISVSNIDALNRRMHRIAWGSSFWLGVQRRRERERAEAERRYVEKHVIPELMRRHGMMPDDTQPEDRKIH